MRAQPGGAWAMPWRRGQAAGQATTAPQPDFLRPEGPAWPAPRWAWGVLLAAALLALAAGVDAVLAWQAQRGAQAEQARWAALAQQHAPLAATRRAAGNGNTPARTAGVGGASGPGAADVAAADTTRLRSAAWAVQARLDHPWAPMLHALIQARWPASVRWLAMDHQAPGSIGSGGSGSTLGTAAEWRLQGQAATLAAALASADALASSGLWQAVWVARVDMAAGAGAGTGATQAASNGAGPVQFELVAQWPVPSPVPSPSPLPSQPQPQRERP